MPVFFYKRSLREQERVKCVMRKLKSKTGGKSLNKKDVVHVAKIIVFLSIWLFGLVAVIVLNDCHMDTRNERDPMESILIIRI